MSDHLQPDASFTDDLLDGEFESVAEVLAGVFEQQAAIVADDAGSASIMAAAAPPADEAPPTPDVEQSSVADSPVSSTPEHEATPATGLAPETASAGEPVAETSAPDPGPAGLDVDPVTVDPRPLVVVATCGRLAGIVIARRVLVPMNAPLRRLPATAQQVLDWVALSLVFWVPVVWILALVLR
ncbi:MAG: hypothetical protein ACYTGC_08760 [Planctomycetota bacterium]|jgi:hypothetical protein